MAKNTGNKRIPIKWIRDLAKKDYKRGEECEACGSKEDLEFHHTHSLTLMFEHWVKSEGLTIETDEDVLAIRQQFIDEHRKELYEEVLTLCNKHHVMLHSVYGKIPRLGSEEAQRNWVLRIRAKYDNKELTIFNDAVSGSGVFAQYCIGFKDFSEFYKGIL
jgi:hypothetical protein